MSALTEHHQQHGSHFLEVGPVRVPAHFGDLPGEYDACRKHVGLHDRSYRGLIEITGADRAAWLSNLTTHEIKSLASGRGNYLFALNVKGRILFDANVLVLPDVLWLDIDQRLIPAALSHLTRYIISEDVQLLDRSDEFARLALIGPASGTAFQAVANAHGQDARATMSPLQHEALSLGGTECRIIRHDFCGLPAFELIVSAASAPLIWDRFRLGQDAHATPVGLEAVQVLRVEAGLPWSVDDIDEEVLPAETGQLERAVSFKKGCYLGQEVVERMRAHRVVARRLVGLVFDADAGQTPPSVGQSPTCAGPSPPSGTTHLGGATGSSSASVSSASPGATLLYDNQPVGRVTSVVNSFALGRPIGLGYVKSALATAGTRLTAAAHPQPLPCSIYDLPFTT